MGEKEALLERLYKAFNAKDLEGLLVGIHEDVEWPNFLAGGSVVGKAALRKYWGDQFDLIDPEATPLEYETLDDGAVRVRLHYLILSRTGAVWTDELRYNTFRFKDGLVSRMDWD